MLNNYSRKASEHYPILNSKGVYIIEIFAINTKKIITNFAMNIIKSVKINKKTILGINFFWWLSIAMILFFFHFSHDLNSDEGIILNGAWNLINGRDLYYDFFEYMPPGSFYLVFWVWKIFGVSYFAAKFVSILLVFSGAIGIYKISRLLINKHTAYLTPLPFILVSITWPLINHNTYSTAAAIWGVYLFADAIKNGRRAAYFLGGIVASITIIILHQKGLALLVPEILILLFLAFTKRNAISIWGLFIFSAGAILPMGAVFLKWSPVMLYNNLIIYPLQNYATIEISGLVFMVFLLFSLCYLAWVFRRENKTIFWPLIIIQLFLLASAGTKSDFTHISLVAFIFFSIWPLAREKIGSAAVFQKYLLVGIYLIIIVIFAKNALIQLYYYPPFYSIKNSSALRFINDNCRDSRYIYSGPFMPGIYFETRLLNPTPFHILLSGFQTDEQFLEARAALEKYKPACAVLNYNITKGLKGWDHDRNNPVDTYIMDNYKPVYRGSGGNKYILRRITK